MLAAAGAGVAALAGCVGGDDGADDTPDGGTTNGEDPPAWQTTTFEDVTTGETLSVAEVDGPVVLHTFATWCSTCIGQQHSLEDLHDSRGESVTMVDLTIDENDNPTDIAAHAENHGFGWRFGVAPAELRDSLVDDIGDNVVVAPQAPVIVVCPDGVAYDLGKGIGADEIESTIDSNCA